MTSIHYPGTDVITLKDGTIRFRIRGTATIYREVPLTLTSREVEDRALWRYDLW